MFIERVTQWLPKLRRSDIQHMSLRRLGQSSSNFYKHRAPTEQRSVYEKVFRVDNLLAAIYSNAGHDFPAEIRNQAYRFRTGA